MHANNYSMEVRSDPFKSARSHFFDTSSWGAFCDVTLTLKQARQPDSGGWVKIDDYRCRQAFRHFMNLLNRAVYGAAFRRYGKAPDLHRRRIRQQQSAKWRRRPAAVAPARAGRSALRFSLNRLFGGERLARARVRAAIYVNLNPASAQAPQGHMSGLYRRQDRRCRKWTRLINRQLPAIHDLALCIDPQAGACVVR